MLHLIKPTISTNSIYSSSNSSVDKRINRLKTGHSNLSEHRWKMKIADHPLHSASVEKVMAMLNTSFCSAHYITSAEMISEIRNSYRSADIEVQHRTIDIQTLLGENEHLPKNCKEKHKSAVFSFVLTTSPDVLI